MKKVVLEVSKLPENYVYYEDLDDYTLIKALNKAHPENWGLIIQFNNNPERWGLAFGNLQSSNGFNYKSKEKAILSARQYGYTFYTKLDNKEIVFEKPHLNKDEVLLESVPEDQFIFCKNKEDKIEYVITHPRDDCFSIVYDLWVAQDASGCYAHGRLESRKANIILLSQSGYTFWVE